MKFFKSSIAYLLFALLIIMPINSNATTELNKVETVTQLRDVLENGGSAELTKSLTINDTSSKQTGRTPGIAITGSEEMVLDGKGFTLDTTSVSSLIEVFAETGKSLNLTIKNLTIRTSVKKGRAVSTRTGNITLNLENVTIDFSDNSGFSQPLTIGSSYPTSEANTINITNSKLYAGKNGYAINTFNKVNITIENSEISGWAALNIRGAYTPDGISNNCVGSEGSTFTIRGSKLSTTNTNNNAEINSFAAIIFEDDDITMTINNSEISSTSEGDAFQFLIGEQEKINYEKTNSVTLTNTKLTADTKEETFSSGNVTTITVGEGVTSNKDLQDATIAEGYVLSNNEGSYVVMKEITSTTTEIDTTKEVTDVTIGVSNATETNSILMDSLKADDDISSKIEGTPVEVNVEVSEIDENTITDEVKDSLADGAGNATISTYFDITVAVKNAVTKNEIDTLDELSSEIELVVLLPETLRNNDSKMTRNYYIIREHNGQVDKLPATLSSDGKSVTFSTKYFSTYALAYEDVLTSSLPNVPQTSDNLVSYVILAILAMATIIASSMYIKRNA